jgi:hypothetical protein
MSCGVLSARRKIIWMFYGKFADEGINAMDNLNIYNVEGDNMLSPGLQPKVYLKSVFLQSSYVIVFFIPENILLSTKQKSQILNIFE